MVLPGKNARYYGFRWYRNTQGNCQPKPELCRIASGYQASPGGTNVDLNIGDPVKRISTGFVDIVSGTEGTPEDIYGIIIAVNPYFTGDRMQPTSVLPGGTTYVGNERQSTVLVCPAAGQLFACDVNDNTTATSEDAYRDFIGENVDHVLEADANTEKAEPRLNISTHATTNTLQWRIVNLSANESVQDYSQENVELIVQVNRSQEAPYIRDGV